MQILKQIFTVKYSKDKIWHNAAMLLAVLLVISICFISVGDIEGGEKYPIDDISEKKVYVQQFDALLKGQAELDVIPDERLAELENPYDPEQREGIYFLWDRAYYEGSYYSYFGIAPIITVYIPYYAFTNTVPSLEAVCLILAIFAVIFTALAYRELIIRFCKEGNLWLVMAGLLSVTLGGGIFLGLRWTDSYYIAVLSGIQNSMAFLFFSLRAMRCRSRLYGSLNFALAAICLTLTVWSRPTVALICLAAIPLFFEFFAAEFRENMKNAIIKLCSFGAVLAAGAVAVMSFNAVRFSSPFDFGAAYQLTVSDISKNSIDVSLFFDAVTSYFLQSPKAIDKFPFVSARFREIDMGGRFLYNARNLGALWFGLPIASLASPIVNALKREKTLFRISLFSVVISVFLAFFNFCYAGVNLRYLLDFLPVMILLAAVMLNSWFESFGRAGRALLAVISPVLFAAAPIMVLGICRAV